MWWTSHPEVFSFNLAVQRDRLLRDRLWQVIVTLAGCGSSFWKRTTFDVGGVQVRLVRDIDQPFGSMLLVTDGRLQRFDYKSAAEASDLGISIIKGLETVGELNEDDMLQLGVVLVECALVISQPWSTFRERRLRYPPEVIES
jgi:hypothetical protein